MDLPSLPEDKANHAIYGAALTAVISCYSVQLAAVICIIAAVGKEVSDWWQNRKGGHHSVEVLDALATIFGGFVVLIPQIVKSGN